MKNYKWRDHVESDGKLVVILMISRNKDNKELDDFKERRASYVTNSDDPMINVKFDNFVRAGRPGEMSRLYVSVNGRDSQVVKKKLLHYLVDADDVNFKYLDGLVAGLAAQKDAAAEKRWLLDFDSLDEDVLQQLLYDLKFMEGDIVDSVRKTPHGYAIVTSRGFDTRLFVNKYGDVFTVKRDDLLLVDWKYKDLN